MQSRTQNPSAPAGTSEPPPAGNAVANCNPPKVTAQRNGETITSIRVECGCGQVVEINCAY